MNSLSNENRRLLLKRGIAAGATFGLSSLIADGPALAVTDDGDATAPGRITAGDLAILNFLAAAELFETDLWQQYFELAQGNPAFREALQATDPSVVQYIIDTERDERSHATFINAYLASIGQPPVNLDAFRTLDPPAIAAAVPDDGWIAQQASIAITVGASFSKNATISLRRSVLRRTGALAAFIPAPPRRRGRSAHLTDSIGGSQWIAGPGPPTEAA